MSHCTNFWGQCRCKRPAEHKGPCVCQHEIEFPVLSDKEPKRPKKEHAQEDL
jgi:hypothetical protein